MSATTRFCLTLILGGLLAASHLAWGQAPSHRGRATGPATLEQVLDADASLHDVCFVDDTHGWVVGDRGQVLATDDGGRSWHTQPVPVDCPLLGVHFVDPQRGWIVGGDSVPYTHRTRGVVLRTIDGGATWQKIEVPTLPRLTGVRFFDPAIGYATGYGAAFYPSGLFTTQDGGKTWQPMATSERATWLAADFLDYRTGVLLATDRHALLTERKLQTVAAANSDPRRARDVQLTGPTTGWLVGDAGRVATTADGGQTWQPLATAPLGTRVASLVDWLSVASHDQHVWIAGSPGTHVAYSHDAGATWKTQPTGISTPIRKVTFVDARRGWAVGDHGTVLQTVDGGTHWQIVRGGDHRAAILVVCGDVERVPTELLSRYAAGEGYRTAVLPMFGSTGENRSRDAHRELEAVAHCGGNLTPPLWRDAPVAAPLLRRGPEELLAELNRQSDGRAKEILTERLVRTLRLWKPELVVVPHVVEGQTSADDALAEQLALDAVKLAAEPTYGVEMAAAIGLGPWQVKRLAGRLPDGQPGTITVPTDAFLSPLGASPLEWAGRARSLLHEHHDVPEPLDQFEILAESGAPNVSTRDLMAGLYLPSDSAARRPQAATDPRDLDRIRRLSQTRKHMLRLLDQSKGNEAWQSQVVNMTGGLPADAGGELVFQLAEGYRQTGRPAMAAQTLYVLAKRYPDHPLSESALVWLVEYYASGELGHLADRERARSVRQGPLANVPSGNPEAATLPDSAGENAHTLSADERWQKAVELGHYIEATRPALYAEPNLRFPLAVASRHLGFGNTAERYFALAGKSNIDPAWRRAVLAEQWLTNPEGLPPQKPIGNCRMASDPPRLDGVLTEPMWQQAEQLALGSGAPNTNASRAVVRLARDVDYLYVAMEVPCLPGVEYAANNESRSRDTDLETQDRVRLLLDRDRDFRTAFDLTVDARGWPGDVCWGDPHWNPQWFIAQSVDETHWRIEAAIPWKELASPPPAVLETWCLAIERVTPRGRTESWTGHTGETPDRFGLLMFR